MTPTALREQIVSQSKEFFAAQHAPKAFVPGQSYIPVTTKVMDADDMAALIDASLDLWLTAGRYSKQFEATIPKYFNRSTTGLLVNSGSSANLVAVSSLGSRLMKQFKMQPLEKGRDHHRCGRLSDDGESHHPKWLVARFRRCRPHHSQCHT